MSDLSDKTELSLYAQIVREIQKISRSKFFLCGATARDLILQHLHGIPTERATLDVDFGVMVETLDEFHAIRQALHVTGKFVVTTNMTRLRYGDTPVDLIPFGAIESNARTVTWPPGDVELNTLGFREAFESAIEVRLPLQTDVKVASLPVQSLLKLIAWGDRNNQRGSKDAQDFRTIAISYHRLVGDDRFYGQQHLLEREDFDVERAGAWILGNDARAQIDARATAVIERVDGILAQELNQHAALTLVSSMGGPSVDRNLHLARWFAEGLRHT